MVQEAGFDVTLRAGLFLVRPLCLIVGHITVSSHGLYSVDGKSWRVLALLPLPVRTGVLWEEGLLPDLL